MKTNEFMMGKTDNNNINIIMLLTIILHGYKYVWWLSVSILIYVI